MNWSCVMYSRRVPRTQHCWAPTSTDPLDFTLRRRAGAMIALNATRLAGVLSAAREALDGDLVNRNLEDQELTPGELVAVSAARLAASWYPVSLFPVPQRLLHASRLVSHSEFVSPFRVLRYSTTSTSSLLGTNHAAAPSVAGVARRTAVNVFSCSASGIINSKQCRRIGCCSVTDALVVCPLLVAGCACD